MTKVKTLDTWDTKPETAADALARWDAGQIVWTVEMGGLGPGYEQVIHIVAFEIIRELLKHEPIDWTQADRLKSEDDYHARRNSEWGRFTQSIEDVVMKRTNSLGMSGAQWGAASSIAYRTMRVGWRKALDELPTDRLLQVSKTWPSLDERSEEPEPVDAVRK